MSLFSKKSPGEVGTGKTGYGIAEATSLMRTLPVDQNVELVVRVIRSTLESMNVQLPHIIDDAVAKETGLQERRATLDAEIAELSREIDKRRQEIVRLEAELTETTTVKERLLLAQKLGAPAATSAPAPAPAPAAAVPPPMPRINGKSAGEIHAR